MTYMVPFLYWGFSMCVLILNLKDMIMTFRKYEKFETEEKYDYMRYEDLARNNDLIKHTGNSVYDDSSSDDDDDDDSFGPKILWEDNDGTSKIRFSFHSDGGGVDRGVSLILSCLYP